MRLYSFGLLPIKEPFIAWEIEIGALTEDRSLPVKPFKNVTLGMVVETFVM